jgi:hypothetical protein
MTMDERESELVVKAATAGIEAMATAAGEFTTDTMLAASMHILAMWIAVESDYTDIDDNVKNISEQLRMVVDSHLDDTFVRNLKTRMKVVGAH